jgi:1-acyl-sn-glycerol-3-phosphate acyltransferase
MTDKARQQQLLHDRGICVVIPTYNNDGTIAAVVADTLKECRDVIVVNDGSTDHTSDILHAIKGITLVEYEKNRGKGHALRCGFERALQMGFAYAITLDADGQHYPHDIQHFLKANQQHPGALIIGNRMLEGVDRPKGSSFANQFSNFWFYIQTGRHLKDTQTGYRLYPLKKLYGLRLLTSRYEAELELLVFASWHGVELVPINIDVYYPPKEQRVSHFRPGKDFARISILNTVLCFLAIVYGLPLRLFRGLANLFRTLYAILFMAFFCFCVITPAVWLYVKIGKKKTVSTSLSEQKRKNLHRLIYHAIRFVMLKHGIPGTKFSYQVDPLVDFSKPSVIICNHQSHIDLACQLIFTPNMIFLTNQWVWNNPLYGLLIRNAEYYPVADGIEELMPQLRSLVERGYSIAVYPEGTRSRDCSIGRFHQGAFHIAEQLGLDVIPMYLYGPGRILPKKSHLLRKGPIYIEVGAPIPQDALRSIGDARAQASHLRKHYKMKYEQIANRIEQD